MGKLGNLAYNIGTSLNKEDINTHRQGITPTTQTLQGLSTEDRLAYHAQNQAVLDENKEQLDREKESGDEFESHQYDFGPIQTDLSGAFYTALWAEKQGYNSAETQQLVSHYLNGRNDGPILRTFKKIDYNYNDMILINVSESRFSYTIAINNKNGKVYVPIIPENSISLSSKSSKVGMSVNFGSIQGGFKTAEEIDSVIEGASVGAQVCRGVCLGSITTAGGDTVITYGLGSPQSGMSSGSMTYSGYSLPLHDLERLRRLHKK